MARALIVTGHFPVQKRRANIPWLCHHMRAEGWHVTFATVGFSWLSRLAGDRRFGSVTELPRAGVTVHDPTLTAIFGWPPVHPVGLRHPLADRAAEPLMGLFARYWRPRLAPHAAQADLIVVESGPPLMLAPALRDAAPDTPMVYRVSDDVELLRMPPAVLRAEQDFAPLFDRISVASPLLARRWAGHPGLAIDPIGVPKDDLARPRADPFGAPRARREVVCAGTTLFDAAQAVAVAQARPEWRVHVIGRLAKPPQGWPANLVWHDELPWDDTIAHVAHADIGLAPYADRPGIEYQIAQSNRMLLYRQFRLPVLGPRRLTDPSLPGLCPYDPDNVASVGAACAQAEAGGRPPADPAIPDWSELYRRIAATRRIRTR